MAPSPAAFETEPECGIGRLITAGRGTRTRADDRQRSDEEVGPNESLDHAVEYASPGIEVHNYDWWFGEPTSQELICSNGIHACLVVGEKRVKPENLDWNMEGVGLFKNGELAASGIGAEIMGGPMKSLRWLVNHLVRQGQSLGSGQCVIPGSAVRLISVEPGDRVAARFAHIGSVVADFNA